ncbi:MAG: beta-aspartyl-peptidase, partial [Myxococcales bacterium]
PTRPVIGAGTYADDRAGAVSGTGDGEGYLRAGVALRVCLGLEQGREPLDMIEEVLTFLESRVASRGGLIVVARDGRLALGRSTGAMSWGACWGSLATLTAGC